MTNVIVYPVTEVALAINSLFEAIIMRQISILIFVQRLIRKFNRYLIVLFEANLTNHLKLGRQKQAMQII